jgi:hypothetical protein
MNKNINVVWCLLVIGIFHACKNQTTTQSTGPHLYSQDTTLPKDTINAANLTFENPIFDFGKVKEGPKLNYVFVMRNIGKIPVVISDVQTTCGCTTAYWPKGAIAPYQSDSIKIAFQTQGNSGAQEKKILVFSNSIRKIIVLTVKGIIQI